MLEAPAVAPCWEVLAESPHGGTAQAQKATKDRFHGTTLTTSQVELEVRRLSVLLSGLVRDFSILKDSVWHLEDERGVALERMNRFEQVDLRDLRAASEETGDRLRALAGKVDGLLEACEVQDTPLKVEQLASQVELLDTRLVAHEDALACRVDLLDARLAAREAALDRLLWLPAQGSSSAAGSFDSLPIVQGEGSSCSLDAGAGGTRLQDGTGANTSTVVCFKASELVSLRDLVDTRLADFSCRMDLLDARLTVQEEDHPAMTQATRLSSGGIESSVGADGGGGQRRARSPDAGTAASEDFSGNDGRNEHRLPQAFHPQFAQNAGNGAVRGEDGNGFAHCKAAIDMHRVIGHDSMQLQPCPKGAVASAHHSRKPGLQLESAQNPGEAAEARRAPTLPVLGGLCSRDALTPDLPVLGGLSSRDRLIHEESAEEVIEEVIAEEAANADIPTSPARGRRRSVPLRSDGARVPPGQGLRTPSISTARGDSIDDRRMNAEGEANYAARPRGRHRQSSPQLRAVEGAGPSTNAAAEM